MKERILEKLMFKKFMIKDIKIKTVDILFVICLFFLSFMIRWSLMPIESADYFGFLEDWMRQIKEAGGFKSLALPISNYTSPYMYIMCILSYLNFSPLYMLKLVSVFFDYAAAIAMFLIVLQITGNVKKSVLGMAAILLSPTAIINSAYWCQCDVIYTAFLLYAFYFLLKGNSKMTMIMVGISFSFKLQALFFIPFLIMMWLKKKTVKLTDFLYIPIIYVISALPAFFMGRSFKDLMLIYFNQSSYYPWGTLEYPNIYALLGETMPDMHFANEVSGAGIYMTVILMGALAYYLYTSHVKIDQRLMVTLSLFSIAVIVYSLPHMHERYGYLVDVLALLYGVLNVKRLFVTCGFLLVSMLSYLPYLIVTDLVPIQYRALCLLGLIIFVGYDLYNIMKANRILKNENPVSQPS